MAKCSCAIDEIAKRIKYEEYAQAEAIARLWEGASPREEAFKSVGLSKERMDKLIKLQRWFDRFLRRKSIITLQEYFFVVELWEQLNYCINVK